MKFLVFSLDADLISILPLTSLESGDNFWYKFFFKCYALNGICQKPISNNHMPVEWIFDFGNE